MCVCGGENSIASSRSAWTQKLNQFYCRRHVLFWPHASYDFLSILTWRVTEYLWWFPDNRWFSLWENYFIPWRLCFLQLLSQSQELWLCDNVLFFFFFCEIVEMRELWWTSLELKQAVRLISFCVCNSGDVKLLTAFQFCERRCPGLVCCAGHPFVLRLLMGYRCGLWGFCLSGVQLNLDTSKLTRVFYVLL